MRVFTLSLLVFISIPAIADGFSNPEQLQFYHVEIPADQFAMGESVLQYEPENSNLVYLNYSEPWGVKELSSRKAGIRFATGKTKNQHWEFSYRQTGDESWQEHHAGLLASALLSNGLRLGIRTTLLHLLTADGSKGTAVIPEIEGSYSLNSRSSLGLRLINPSQSGLKTERRTLKYTFTAHGGLEYKQNPYCRFRIETSWHIDQPVTLRGGLEYLLLKKIALRCGYHTMPGTATWGMGFPYKKIQLDYGSSLHSVLGLSHSFTMKFTWK